MLVNPVCQNYQKNSPSFKAIYLNDKDIEEIGGKVALHSFEKAKPVLQELGEYYNILVLKNRLEPNALEIRVLSKPSIPGTRCSFDDIKGSINLDNETKISPQRILGTVKAAIFNFIDAAKDREKKGVDQIFEKNVK